MQKDIVIKYFSNPDKWRNNLHEHKASIFLHPDWIESVRTENLHAVYFDFQQGNNVLAKLSGIIAIGKFGKVLHCYAGIALKDNTIDIESLYELLHDYAKKQNVNRIIIGSYDQRARLQIKHPKFFITKRSEFIIKLNETPQFSKQIKRNIKKALIVECDITNDTNNTKPLLLFNLLDKTQEERQKRGKPSFSPFYLQYSSYESTSKLLESDIAQYFICREKQQICCLEFNLIVENRLYNYLRGADGFAYKNGIPSLMAKNMIDWAIKKNISEINLGGRPSTNDGEALARFKKGLGAKEVIQYGLTTNFILFPYTLLNPLLNIIRRLKDVPFIYKLKDRLL